MHLNYECLRDVLVVLEKLLEIRAGDFYEFCMVSVQDVMQDPDISGYTEEDVFYCIYNLEQAGFLETSKTRSGVLVHNLCVIDITYTGHMFLRSISDETVWTLIKKKLGPAFSVSIPVIQQLAGGIIADQFQLSS